MYLDPAEIDTTITHSIEKRQHTRALLADAERALSRVRMEGTYMTDDLTGAVAVALIAVQAAQRPDTAIGVGLHEVDDDIDSKAAHLALLGPRSGNGFFERLMGQTALLDEADLLGPIDPEVYRR